jgi:hypothetical protein
MEPTNGRRRNLLAFVVAGWRRASPALRFTGRGAPQGNLSTGQLPQTLWLRSARPRHKGVEFGHVEGARQPVGDGKTCLHENQTILLTVPTPFLAIMGVPSTSPNQQALASNQSVCNVAYL